MVQDGLLQLVEGLVHAFHPIPVEFVAQLVLGLLGIGLGVLLRNFVLVVNIVLPPCCHQIQFNLY